MSYFHKIEIIKLKNVANGYFFLDVINWNVSYYSSLWAANTIVFLTEERLHMHTNEPKSEVSGQVSPPTTYVFTFLWFLNKRKNWDFFFREFLFRVKRNEKADLIRRDLKSQTSIKLNRKRKERTAKIATASQSSS